MEEHSPEHETHHHTAASDHRHDADHRIRQTQGIEIHEICCRKKEADTEDRPRPVERCCFRMFWPPEEPQHQTHHGTLVNIIPRLHHHAVESYAPTLYRRHQVFVIESAQRPKGCSAHNHIDPVVVLEIDALFLSATAQQEERRHCQKHTDPLPDVQAFAKHQKRTHQHHHRSCGIDRPHDGQGQMLHAEIAENPTRQNDNRL